MRVRRTPAAASRTLAAVKATSPPPANRHRTVHVYAYSPPQREVCADNTHTASREPCPSPTGMALFFTNTPRQLISKWLSSRPTHGSRIHLHSHLRRHDAVTHIEADITALDDTPETASPADDEG
ncbi:hypothetical protein GCM10018965_050410 [Nonomuraea roseola]